MGGYVSPSSWESGNFGPQNSGGGASLFGMGSGATGGLLAGLGGLGGLLGGMGGQNQDLRQTKKYNFSPLQQSLANNILSQGNSFLNSIPNLGSYLSSGLKKNQTQNNQNLFSLRSTLASRGLSYSPLASAEEASTNINTGNQNAQLANQIPLLQRQLQLQALQGAGQAFGAIPQDYTQEQTSLQKQGLLGSIGQGISGAAGILGMMAML